MVQEHKNREELISNVYLNYMNESNTCMAYYIYHGIVFKVIQNILHKYCNLQTNNIQKKLSKIQASRHMVKL